jgi:CheY-like chemotaxis protein
MVTTHYLSEQRKRAARILLVEDNPVNRRMTQIMLSKAGYDVHTAVGGRDAVEMYVNDPGAYDIVLMDINMPEMDGFEVTEQIRRHEKRDGYDGNIPVIALTAHVLPEFREKSEAVGMNGFLTKPVTRKGVFDIIHKWVSEGPVV